MFSLEEFLYKHLGLRLNRGQVISIVGGGGKTTAMFILAKELKELGKKILITTTTNIFVPEKETYDNFFLKEDKLSGIKASTISILGERIVDGKIKGPDTNDLEAIIKKDLFDFYLIEADGAKRKPIKAPNTYEPILVDSTTVTLGLIGLDALFKNIVETSHRSNLLMNLLVKDPQDIIEANDIVTLVLHKDGLFKDYKGKRILLLNKAIDEKRIEQAEFIKDKLKDHNFDMVLIADIVSKKFY